MPDDADGRRFVDDSAGEIGPQDTGRLDRGHLDPALGLDPQRIGEHVHRRLGGAVDAGALGSGVAVDGRNVDDVASALLDHRVVDGRYAVHDAFDVDVDRIVPSLPGAFVVGEERQRHHTCVVHNHVDGAVSVDGVSGRGLDLDHVGDVCDMRGGLETRGPDTLENLVQAFGVDVHTDDPRATGGALFRNQLAEAAGCAGHDDDLVLQVLRHSSHGCTARYAATTGCSSSGVAPCMITASAP